MFQVEKVRRVWVVEDIGPGSRGQGDRTHQDWQGINGIRDATHTGVNRDTCGIKGMIKLRMDRKIKRNQEYREI